jgi:hypothetical protein
MRKITKHLLSLALLLALFVPFVRTSAAGTLQVTDLGTNEVSSGIELGEKSPIDTATSLINTVMIFLGLIAVCIILVGGFKWMTAMGSEDKIGEAKKLMGAGVVGIIIILSAWGIAKFVLEKAVDVTK